MSDTTKLLCLSTPSEGREYAFTGWDAASPAEQDASISMSNQLWATQPSSRGPRAGLQGEWPALTAAVAKRFGHP